jgi:hypothetical protein
MFSAEFCIGVFFSNSEKDKFIFTVVLIFRILARFA